MTQRNAFNYLAFVILMASTAMGYQSLWALMFLYWTIRSFATGYVFLLSETSRQEDPLLFWLIQITWLVLAALMIAADFYPEWR